jgi:hypothetical protein
MKMNKLAFAALAALAVSLTSTGASAQVAASQTDMIFGVQDENGNNGGSNFGANLEVDLGAESAFTTSAVLSFPQVTLNDLKNIFSSNWSSTTSGASWSVFGSTATIPSFYDTNNQGNPGDNTSATLNGVYSLVNAVYGGLNTTTNASATYLSDTNGKGAQIGSNSNPANVLTNSYGYNETGKNGANGPGFGYAGGDETVGAGTDELYFISTAGGSKQDAVDLGTFSLSSAGVLTFNGINAAAVPEPSAYALGVCAVLLFLVLRRRQSVS